MTPMHPTNPGGFGVRASTSVRLRHDAYRALMAHRAINHDWPAPIQRLWYACEAAQAAMLELEGAAHVSHMDSAQLRDLAQLQYRTWQAIEQYAAAVLAAYEGGTR